MRIIEHSNFVGIREKMQVLFPEPGVTHPLDEVLATAGIKNYNSLKVHLSMFRKHDLMDLRISGGQVIRVI